MELVGEDAVCSMRRSQRRLQRDKARSKGVLLIERVQATLALKMISWRASEVSFCAVARCRIGDKRKKAIQVQHTGYQNKKV